MTRTFIAAMMPAVLFSCAFPCAASAQTKPLREEVEALNAAMVAALKTDPASVARFYTDDASILGGGGRYVGRAEVDRYWRDATMFADWTLEVIEVGGEGQTPWVRGRSTLHGKSGRRMATEYIGILKRGPDGQLRFYVDMFVAASGGTRPAGGAQGGARQRPCCSFRNSLPPSLSTSPRSRIRPYGADRVTVTSMSLASRSHTALTRQPNASMKFMNAPKGCCGSAWSACARIAR